MNSALCTEMILGLLIVLVGLQVTVSAFGKKSTSDPPSTDINWGSYTTHCDKNEIVSPKNEMTYRSPSKDLPIVGIFATRYDKTSFVWGEGKVRGMQVCKNICYKDSRVFYSVVLGTTAAPQTIDMKFASKSKEICGYGYSVKVCYKTV